MCVYMYIYIYIYMFTTYIYIYTYIHVYMYMHFVDPSEIQLPSSRADGIRKFKDVTTRFRFSKRNA